MRTASRLWGLWRLRWLRLSRAWRLRWLRLSRAWRFRWLRLSRAWRFRWRVHRRASIIGLIALAAIASAAIIIWQGSIRQIGPFRPAPAWISGAIQCPSNPMDHVSMPTRLDVIARCSALSGIVRSVDRDSHDLELVILVEPDPQYAKFIDPRIQRYVIVKVPPFEQPGVNVPGVDEHATFYGSWVVNRRASEKGTLELHPTWAITTEHAPSGATPAAVLDVTISSAASVAVGAPLQLRVTVKTPAQLAPEAVSEAVIYVELSGPDGVSRSAAELSNGFGTATLSIAALENPGVYTIWAHASKGHDFGTAKVSLTIHRT